MTSLETARTIGGVVGASVAVAGWLIHVALSAPQGLSGFFAGTAVELAFRIGVLLAPLVAAGLASGWLARARPQLGSLAFTALVMAAAVACAALVYLLGLLTLGTQPLPVLLTTWAYGVFLALVFVAPWALLAGWLVFFLFDRMAVVAYQRVCLAK